MRGTTMPETAIDKHRQFLTRKGNIDFETLASQRPKMHSEPEAGVM